MADTKLTALSAWTPALASLVYVVDDPSGTPVSRKATFAEIRTLFGGLTFTAGGADAGQSMAVNTIYFTDISGYTADRTYTLPGTAAVGDLCGIMLTAGDTAFELLITATAGDTLNGVAGGTEWSRLFITGEVVLMRCVVANTTWIVEEDGRIAMKALMECAGQADGESAATYTTPTAASTPGSFTAIYDVGDGLTVASSLWTARRAGKFHVCAQAGNKDAGTTSNYYSVRVIQNGSTELVAVSVAFTSATSIARPVVSKGVSLAADDTVTYQYRSQAGGLGLTTGSSIFMSVAEILP